MAEEKDTGARSDGVLEKSENRTGVWHRPGQSDFFYDDPVAFGAEIPGMLATGMLLVGHQDLVTGLEVNAVGDVAVRFRGVPEEGQFIAFATDKLRERIAKLVPRGVAPDGVVPGDRPGPGARNRDSLQKRP